MSMEEIRRAYKVPAKVGGHVDCAGRLGEIVGARELRLRVRLAGDPTIRTVHPTRGITYLDEERAS